MVDLWHFTCEHGYAGIEQTGEAVPAVVLRPELTVWWPARYVWLTHDPDPDIAGLGLTRLYQKCDRTRYRYRVTDMTGCYRWQFARGRYLDSHVLADLEHAFGARPESWWVSHDPVAVVLDPP